MASRINLLFITCRDSNFPHAGYVVVKLLRVKHQIKIKCITTLPKKLHTRTDYYIAHTENFLVDKITEQTIEVIYNQVVEQLNYTADFKYDYGYSEGDFAGGSSGDLFHFYNWLKETIYSFK